MKAVKIVLIALGIIALMLVVGTIGHQDLCNTTPTLNVCQK